MKKLFLFVFLLLLLLNIKTYSQDTNIVKYLPLKVGNVWIYNSGSASTRIRITGTMIANGHIYYISDLQGAVCNCAQGNFPPFLADLPPLRVDSLNGNIMFYGNQCQWQLNEHLFDSLNTRIGNSANNSCNITQCTDTSNQNVFGVIRKTKVLGQNYATYFSLRRYAMGIGLIGSNKGCFFSGCSYVLTGCVINGVVYGDTGFVVGINQISSQIPDNYSLSQNYPNPFNPTTNIKFQIVKSSNAKLIIYDALGKEVETLLDKKLEPGEYEAEFNATDLPSGVYYYKLVAGDYTETKKMVLIK